MSSEIDKIDELINLGLWRLIVFADVEKAKAAHKRYHRFLEARLPLLP